MLASDRGPKDGATDYACRFHRLDIRVTPGAANPVTVALTSTTLLTDGRGRRFVGTLGAFTNPDPTKNLRLDPEGVRVGRGGEVYVADEYGPVVYEFGPGGERRRSLPVPARFRAPRPGKTPADELPPHSTSGRQPNRGMEWLAISPDGTRLVGVMQSPLLQDGALDAKNERVGVNCRVLELTIATGRTREFVYRLDDAAHGVSEIVAVDDHRFLVLERDCKAGADAVFKRVFLIDLAGATDASGVAALPSGTLPAAVAAVGKVPFLDLLAPRYGIAGAGCPEKFEGLAFRPDLPDGRRIHHVTHDNDFVADRPLPVYAFAVGTADLPDFTPQRFRP